MDVIKANKQNETLINELTNLEERIKQEILSYDQTEFAPENVQLVLHQFLFSFNSICFLLDKSSIYYRRSMFYISIDRYPVLIQMTIITFYIHMMIIFLKLYTNI